MSRSIFTRAGSARILASFICLALTGRLPTPCSTPLAAGRAQLISVCLGTPRHTRRHRRFLPRLDQPDGLQLELHHVQRAAIRSVFLARLSCSMNAFSTSAVEYVFGDKANAAKLTFGTALSAAAEPKSNAVSPSPGASGRSKNRLFMRLAAEHHLAHPHRR